MSLVKTKPSHKLTKLEFLVLLSLKKKPLHGYGIMKRLDKNLPGVWKPKSGSLYPLLKRMKKKGLLESKNVKGKNKYFLTSGGEEAINQYIHAWKELYEIFKQMTRK
jgi:DNA-binding PadR family transcriptional regulator